jgi:hypothetical protein
LTSLREAVQARMPKPVTDCKVCVFLDEQDDETRAEWLELLAEPNEVLSASAIADEMTERRRAKDPAARTISYNSVNVHRRHD